MDQYRIFFLLFSFASIQFSSICYPLKDEQIFKTEHRVKEIAFPRPKQEKASVPETELGPFSSCDGFITT